MFGHLHILKDTTSTIFVNPLRGRDAVEVVAYTEDPVQDIQVIIEGGTSKLVEMNRHEDETHISSYEITPTSGDGQLYLKIEGQETPFVKWTANPQGHVYVDMDGESITYKDGVWIEKESPAEKRRRVVKQAFDELRNLPTKAQQDVAAEGIRNALIELDDDINLFLFERLMDTIRPKR